MTYIVSAQHKLLSSRSNLHVLSCFVLPACLYNHMPIPATSDVAPSMLRAASSALHVPVQPTPWSTRASHAMHSLHMVDILSQNIPVNHNCFPPSVFISLSIGIDLLYYRHCPPCWVQTFLVPFLRSGHYQP
jgi:hypothetical protein